MANLLFKKGSYENFVNNVLTGNKAVEGTLYFTEDEGGLYVGQTGGVAKRIQGSVLYFENLQEFTSKIKPPYSSEVIYFIANNNALVRWREDTTLANGGEWKILNFTYDDGVALTTRVGSLESGLSDLNNALGDYALKSVTDTLKNELDDAILDIAANAGDIATANANIADHEERLDEIEDQLPNLAEKSALESGISNLQGQIDTIHDSAETNRESIESILGTIGDKDTENTIWHEIHSIKSDLGETNGNLGNYVSQENFDKIIGTKSLEGTVIDNIESLKTSVTTNGSNITEIKNSIGTETLEGGSIIANINTLKADVDDIEGKLPDLATKEEFNNTVTSINSSISDINESITSINDTIGTEALGNSNSIKKNIIDLREVINQHSAELDTINTKSIPDLAEDIKGINATILTLAAQKDLDDAVSDIAEIKTSIGTETLKDGSIIANINVLKKDVDDIEGKLPDLATKQELNSAVTTINGSIRGINESIGMETLEDGSIKKNINDLKSTVSGHTTTIGNHAETIDELIEADKDLKGQIDGLDEKLSEQIDTHIKAANALSYKGVITSLNNLPELNVSIGDTYVVGAGYAAGENDAYGPGDLLIAYGPENDDGFIPSDDLQWHHVDIGYNETFEPNLSISENVVQLKSHVNESLGSFTIAGSENVTVTTDATSNTITVGMVWGSF